MNRSIRVLVLLALIAFPAAALAPSRPVATNEAWATPCVVSNCLTVYQQVGGDGWSRTIFASDALSVLLAHNFCGMSGPQAAPWSCLLTANDVTSSFRITVGTWCLYAEADYGGDVVCHGAGIWNVPVNMNDRISSARPL